MRLSVCAGSWPPQTQLGRTIALQAPRGPSSMKKTDKNLPELLFILAKMDAFFDGKWEKSWIRTRKTGRDPGAPGKHPGVPGIFEKVYPGEA